MEDRLHSALDHVRADDRLKSSTLDFLEGRRSRSAARPSLVRPLAAVCAALFLLLGGGGYWAMAAPVSYVSVDGEASVELCLNRFDRVVKATGRWGDRELSLEELHLKGRTCTDAIDVLLLSETTGPYLDGSEALSITVKADNKGREAALLSGIQGCAGYQHHYGQSGNGSDTSDAAGSGASGGNGAHHGWSSDNGHRGK